MPEFMRQMPQMPPRQEKELSPEARAFMKDYLNLVGSLVTGEDTSAGDKLIKLMKSGTLTSTQEEQVRHIRRLLKFFENESAKLFQHHFGISEKIWDGLDGEALRDKRRAIEERGSP